jgi:plastocyanin
MSLRSAFAFPLVVLGLVSVVGCGSSETATPVTDADVQDSSATDTAIDSSADALADSTAEATPDAIADGADAADGTSDATPDGTTDAADAADSAETASDGATEAAADAASETAPDAPASSCSDGLKNGVETDVDCGGSGICARCATGKACAVNADCFSGTCSGGLCVTLTNGCNPATALDLTGSTTAAVAFGGTSGLAYVPACIRVKVGTNVTFNGSFSSHPLQGGTVAGAVATPASTGPFATMTNTGTTATFTMSATGTFPYYCVAHATTANMMGAVFVVP